MEFVVIVFNSRSEVNLLKLQAYSFRYLTPGLVSAIRIFINDLHEFRHGQFKDFLRSEVHFAYPEALRSCVTYHDWSELGVDANLLQSNWFSQQAAKLEISSLVKSDYYCILDSKNHFIKPLSKSDFFSSDNKALLATNPHGPEMLNYYHNCLSFFDIESPFVHKNIACTAATPFVMHTNSVRLLISKVISSNEVFSSFLDFFDHHKKYTEFFIYFSFLLSSGILEDFHSIDGPPRCAGFGSANPLIIGSNTLEYQSNALLCNSFIKTFGFHRCYSKYISSSDEDLFIEFYSQFFNDIEISVLKDVIALKNEFSPAFGDWTPPLDFSPSSYRDLNPDLLSLSNSEITHHYVTQGYKELRCY